MTKNTDMETQPIKKYNIVVNKKPITTFFRRCFWSGLFAVIALSIYYFPYFDGVSAYLNDGSFNISVSSAMFDKRYVIGPEVIVCWKDRPVRKIDEWGYDYSDKTKYSFFSLNSSQRNLLNDELLISEIYTLNKNIIENASQQQDSVYSAHDKEIDFETYNEGILKSIDSLDKVLKELHSPGNTDKHEDIDGLIIAKSFLEASVFDTEEEWRQAREDQERKISEGLERERWEIERLQDILNNKRENIDYVYNTDGTIELKMQRAGSFEVFFVLILPLIFTLKFKVLLSLTAMGVIVIYVYQYLRKNVGVSLK